MQKSNQKKRKNRKETKRMLNTIILMGRLTRDPELRKSSNDTSIANFTLAIDNPNVDANGERGTTFIDVRCFGKVADSVCQHNHKGSKVAVTGALTSRSYLAKDGSKRVVFEIQADSVEFLDPLPAKPVDEKQKAEQAEAELDLPDDDLPFKEEETKPQEKVKPAKKQEPKFDPYTGKPLKPKSSK